MRTNEAIKDYSDMQEEIGKMSRSIDVLQRQTESLEEERRTLKKK